ncbi:MAG: hypothetical protein R3A52_00085 [Polyangiales bacterium]
MTALERLLRQMSDPSELSWREETYDLALARTLEPSERASYVAALIERAKRGDTHAVLTLGHLGATEALPTLRADAKRAAPWAATARRALVLLGEGADVVEEVARDAVSSPAKMARVAAIMDLSKIGGPAASRALQQALVDEDSDVRVIAWDALVEALGLTKQLQSPEGRRELTTEVEVLRVLLASDVTALVKVGAAGMRDVARRLSAGETAQQLGIAWRPRSSERTFDALRAAMYRGGALPIDEVKALKGAERYLAEAMIARRLEDGDERVPDALVALDAAWTAPALQELAESDATDAAMRAKLARAARVLATTRSG